MGIFIVDANQRIATPLKVDVQNQTVEKATQVAPRPEIHPQQHTEELQSYRDLSYHSSPNTAPIAQRFRYVIEIMSKPALSVEANQSIDSALRFLQEHDFHHLPVVKHDRVIAFLSDTTLLRAKTQGQKKQTLEALAAPYLAVSESTLIKAAAIAMLVRNTSGVPVQNEHSQVVGVLTLKDILKEQLNLNFEAQV